MPESAVQTFLAIPELVVLLSLHVHKKDLPRCILVCKDWLQHFEPVLWRRIFITERVFSILSTVPPPRLVRNLHHLQEVDFDRADGSQLQLLTVGLPYHLGSTVSDPDAGCTNLKHLSVSDLDEDGLQLMSRPLVKLLDYNPHLTRLDVQYEVFHIDGVSAAVSKLWHLQKLAVQSYLQERAQLQNPFLFLESCLALPQLTELTFHIDLEMDWDRGEHTTIVRELDAIVNAAVIARFSQNPTAKRIKILQLPSKRSGPSNPLPLLLIKSKLLDLETCGIPWFRGDATIQEIEQVVREHCPNLKHLECPQFFEDGRNRQDGRAARAFIRGCSGLQSFTSLNFMDGPDHAPRYILSELVTHHHTTLEVLELEETLHVSSRDLQKVLSQCKQLKRFWVLGNEGDDSRYGIAFRDIFKSDWVCTELRELGVALNRCRSGRDASGELGEEELQDDPHVWLTASTTKRAYQQIGQLKKLEVLEIDIDRASGTKAKERDYAWDLTLRKGWLGEWAGLKNLRSLRLLADFWSCMSQEDVEFMHEHWPKLDEIVFHIDNPEFYTKQQWQWLLQKRPNLRFKGERRNRLWNVQQAVAEEPWLLN